MFDGGCDDVPAGSQSKNREIIGLRATAGKDDLLR